MSELSSLNGNNSIAISGADFTQDAHVTTVTAEGPVELAAVINRLLDESPAADRADSALQIARQLDDQTLAALAKTPEGSAILQRLDAELNDAPGGLGDVTLDRARLTQATGSTTTDSPGIFGQVGGVFVGVYEVGKETVSGVVSLAVSGTKTAYDLQGGIADSAILVGETVSGRDIEKPDWLPSTQRGVDRLQTGSNVVGTIVRNPGMIVDAVVDPIKEDWNAGRYGEAVGRGVGEVAGVVFGAKGVDKVAKGAKVADTVADGARVAGRVTPDADDATRIARGSSNLAVRQFDNIDDFNRAANNAIPNTIYEHGTYRWTTDDAGRVIKAEGRVDFDAAGRNQSLQRQIGNEGRDTDVGFHLIADSFNGPTNRLNVVPGNGKPIGDGVPNLNTGAFQQFENRIRDLNNSGRDVEIRVEPKYTDGNTTSRPDTFDAYYREAGGVWFRFKLTNK